MLPMTKIRWLTKRDQDEVLDISKLSFEYPMPRAELLAKLRRRNCIAMVAEDDHGRVSGYMIYCLERRTMTLEELAVHPDDRRQGVGRLMMEKLQSKLLGKRVKIVTMVRESNLNAQLFFKSMGFDCTEQRKNFYDCSTEDAYQFEHCTTEEVCEDA
jgi:ribosomal-protein-alanine N-acetyltransferase